MRLFAISALLAAGLLNGQDTRNVTEPVIPAACATLDARLSSVEGGKTLAEADEATPDTKRIQSALDHCAKGQAVVLQAAGGHDAFLTGPLELRPGIAVVVAGKTILFGSRNPRDYDLTPGSCGIINEKGHGCKPMFGGSGVPDASIMGDGTIDGRGWAKLTGQKDSWWDLAQQAKPLPHMNQNCPRIVEISRCNKFTIYRITLKNSGNFHVAYKSGDGFTAWGVIIDTPKTARNTDGIDPGNSTNVTITHCYIHTGDDNVAIKAGAGAPTTYMTIAHNHFYTGHGMSIGSETDGGASAIRVTDLTIDGADNGIRIKSNSGRGGLVRDVVYDDVCIRDTKNPIFMDSDYEHYGKKGTKFPKFEGIELHNVHVLGGGKVTLQGLDEEHRLGMAFDNVTFDSPSAIKLVAEHARLKAGPGAMNLGIAGEDVEVTGKAGPVEANACTGRFVGMPSR